MLNYLLFLSMVHEYAYFVMNIFGKRSIVLTYLFFTASVSGVCPFKPNELRMAIPLNVLHCGLVNL